MAKKTPTTPWFGVPNNRQEALRIGHPYYFTGKPCIHGHLSMRDSKDRKCQQCERIFVQRDMQRPERKAKFLAWSRANKDKRGAASKRSKTKHREAVRARMRDWWQRNREARAEKRKIWAANNKPKIYASNAARRASEILATPPWAYLYQAEIEAIYAERKRLQDKTGVKYHVDHIYPLRGKDSCGLHVPWNLRVILASENVRKSNRPPTEDIIIARMGNGLPSLGAASKSNVAAAP
jgi:hypothetical protein